MRFLLALIGLAAVVVAVLLSLGLMTLKTTPGSMPSVSFNGGTAPSVNANLATVTMGTENKVIGVAQRALDYPPASLCKMPR